MNHRSLGLGQALLWATTLLATALMLDDGAQKTQMLLLFTSLAAASLLLTVPGRGKPDGSARHLVCRVRKSP